jgi:RNA polymerase sigma factor (sigma-70 family)
MATGQLNGVVQQLRRAALREGGPTDGELLEGFLAVGDEAAFAELMYRHGPMVLGVCRRVLGNAHDAEDAFQATFLVLARRAAAVRPRDLVGNRLYGVACRTALKARTAAARRRARERQVPDVPTTEPAAEAVWRDLQPLLDEELNRLPDRYRVPVVLCDLEGRSQREAARQLGWPDGTLATRLTRARRLLAQRLTRRGVALSAGAVALMLTQQAAASVPAALAANTVQAAALAAAGKAVTAVVSAEVVALTQGVLQAMFLTKVKSALIVLILVGVLGAGTALLGHRGLGGQSPAAEAAAVPQERAAQERRPDTSGDRAQDRGQGRDAPTLLGRVVEVAKDGKSITVAASLRDRDNPSKVTIQVNEKTKILYTGVGPDGAKLAPGLMVQVWIAAGTKDVAEGLHVMGKEAGRRTPDVTGKVAGVAKDGTTFTVQLPAPRGEVGATVEVKITPKTDLRYSMVPKGGTKPTEGYQGSVWLAPGSKDTAAQVSFQSGERGERIARRQGGVGKVVAVNKDGKGVTLEMPPQERGGEAVKRDVQFDDMTRFVYLNVKANGDRPTVGYQAQVWFAEGSKDRVEQVLFQAPEEEGQVLRGRVVGVAPGGKGFTVELPPAERGAEGKRVEVKITDRTRVVYMGVGPDGARLTEGYAAQVWLEDGSAATQVMLSADGRR